MKRALLIHLPPSRVHLLSELRKCGLDVVFFTTNGEPRRAEYEEMAPGVPYVSNHKALTGRSPVLGQGAPALLRDIERLAATEAVALHCFDRSNAEKRSIHDQHSIYLAHVGLWRHVLDRFKPDVVIFGDNPHHGWDNVLYDLCRSDGMGVAMIAYTELERRVLVKTSIEDVPGPSTEEIDAAVASGDEIKEVTLDVINAALNKSINNLQKIRRKASLLGAARLLIGVNQLNRTGTEAGLVFYGDEHPRHIKVRWNRFRNRLAGRGLLKHYDSFAVDPDIASKYVYFPLPMQPEMTTVPLAGHFSDQVNLVRTVASALPAGWRLYVKEHPAQFLWQLSNRGRSTRQYDMIRAIPNVTVIRLEINSAYLVEHAQAVATATGTSGFEAVERGVPAIVFGSPWYRRAPGVIAISTVEECREAFSRVARGAARPDPARVRAYKHLMGTRYSVEAIFDDGIALQNDKQPEATAARLAKAISAAFERQAGRPTEHRRGEGSTA